MNDNWKPISWDELERHIDNSETAQLSVKLSPKVAKMIVEALTQYADRKEKTAGMMICEHNCFRLLEEAKEVRNAAAELDSMVSKWESDNPL